MHSYKAPSPRGLSAKLTGGVIGRVPQENVKNQYLLDNSMSPSSGLQIFKPVENKSPFQFRYILISRNLSINELLPFFIYGTVFLSAEAGPIDWRERILDLPTISFPHPQCSIRLVLVHSRDGIVIPSLNLSSQSPNTVSARSNNIKEYLSPSSTLYVTKIFFLNENASNIDIILF